MNNKIKNVSVILGVVLFIILVASITYAVFGWASDPDNGYIEGKSECFNISYTKGDDILDGSLTTGNSYVNGLSVTVSAGLDTNCNIEKGLGTLYLDTKEETSDALLGLIRYQVLENGTPVDGGSGTVTTKGKIEVYSDFEITTEEKEYTVYIWLKDSDITDENREAVGTSIYSGGVSMTAESR